MEYIFRLCSYFIISSSNHNIALLWFFWYYYFGDDMNELIIIGVIVAVIGVILIIFINGYNRFQWTITLVQKGETNIMNALEKKYHILMRYFDFLKENKVDIDQYEYEEYKLLNTKQQVVKLNKKINNMNNIINKYMDNNEKLLKNETIININKELEHINISINGGKKYYNDNLIIYNHLCTSFPSNIISRIMHYKEKEYLDEEMKEELKILDE